MDTEKIVNVLESTGLRRNEILIYLTLVKLGKSSVLELSKETKIHRPNVYDTLEELLKKGIVDQSNENGKRFFYPIRPSDLLDYLKQKEQELEEIIPEIEQIEAYKEESQRVTLSKGENSIRNIISHLTDLKQPIYAFGFSQKEIEKRRGFYDSINRQRIKMKIPIKIIFENYSSETIKEIKNMEKMDHTEAKYCPTLNTGVSTFIVADKVIIVIWNLSEVILIQNKFMAETYKEYFDILWERAKLPIEVISD